jgi:polyhydroxyalkanoate synthesis regulator phasin
MEQNKLFTDLFSFMKTNYETALKTMEMVQEQAEKTLEIVVDQSATVQGEAKKAIKDWAANGKKLSEEYKKYSEDYLKKMENYFEGSVKKEK